METFKLPLPFRGPHGSTLLDVSGERLLQGGADTGVFRVRSIGEHLATRERRVGRDEDGLALATIECDGPLELADRDRGSDPYNRLGRRTR